MKSPEQILKHLMWELENALESDRDPAVHFKDIVWRALKRAQEAAAGGGGAGAPPGGASQTADLWGGCSPHHAGRGKKYLA